MEIGGSTERLDVASEGARFGFGVCGSINETASLTTFGAGAGSGAGAALGAAALRPVIGANAERVAGTAAFSFDFGAGVAAAGAGAGVGVGAVMVAISSVGTAFATSLVTLSELLVDFAVLEAVVPERDDFAADEPVLVVLRADALRAVVLVVVVFVGM